MFKMFLQLKSAQSPEPINNMIRMGLCFLFFFFPPFFSSSFFPVVDLLYLSCLPANTIIWCPALGSRGDECLGGQREILHKVAYWRHLGSAKAWGGRMSLGIVIPIVLYRRNIVAQAITWGSLLSSGFNNLGQCLSPLFSAPLTLSFTNIKGRQIFNWCMI